MHFVRESIYFAATMVEGRVFPVYRKFLCKVLHHFPCFQILTVSANQSSDIFRAAPVSMGLLGVITEVTFQCEPTFNVEETTTTPPFSECVDNLRQMAYSAEHARVWLELWSRSCAYLQANRTKKKARDNPNRLVAALKASQCYFDLYYNMYPSQPPMSYGQKL